MFRGTSPCVRLHMAAQSAERLAKYYISFSQDGKELFTVDNSACNLVIDGDTAYIECELGQDKTLAMSDGLDIDIQIRAIMTDGRATASPVVSRPVFGILHDGYIS